MNSAAQNDMDLMRFLLFFICLWLAVSCLISILGGWHSLAKQFRSTAKNSEKLFLCRGFGLTRWFLPACYNACVYVGFDSAGIALSMFPLFRFFHPKLLIPWNVVSTCKQEKYWFLKCTAVYISEPPTQMRFSGKLGNELYAFWSARTNAPHVN